MVQHRGRHAQQTAAAAASRDQAARDEGADERHLRRRTDRPGDVDGAFHRHPRRGAGDLQDMAAYAAGARHGTGKSPRHPGEDLFQERKRIARRIAQAQHRRAAGLLQLQAGHTPPDDRNGRRAVGRGHRLRSQALRARRAGFHGEGQLRTETLPAADDEHVGRRVHRVAQHNHRLGPRGARTRPRLLGKPRAGDLGGRGDGSATPGGHPLLPGQRAEPRDPAPDRHRAGGGRTDGDGRRRAGRGDRLLRRRQQFRRAGLPVPA